MTTSSIPPDEIVALEEIENSSINTVLSMKECVTQFSETNVGNTALVVANIHSIWEQIVGQDICQHVKVRYVRDGILYLVSDHPAWMTQLKYMNDNIISQLNESEIGEKITSISTSISLDRKP